MKNKNVEIRSIIHKVLAEASGITDGPKIQELFVEAVEESSIKEIDKKAMILTMKKMDTYKKVVTYMYNSLLKYEGDGTIIIR